MVPTVRARSIRLALSSAVALALAASAPIAAQQPTFRADTQVVSVFATVTDGQNLRIPIPPLTEERRKDLVKVAGKYAEQQRVAVRNIRRDANDDLRTAEKSHVISQDEEKRMEGEVQKLTDEAIRRVDEALKTKEQEIMHV